MHVREGLLVAAAMMVSLLCGAAAPALAQFPDHRDTLTVGAGESVVCLNRGFVFASTLRLREGDREWIPDLEFVADPDAGCLTLLLPDTLGAGRTLIASYQALPLTLQGVVRLREDPHRRQTGQPADAEAPASTPLAYAPAAASEGLTFSGSKTFGIEVGNRRDLKLRQSLDLRLTGQVTQDVSLLAILSDQDVPFQPEGNTAELAELDRVLIQIRAPRAGASLGDVNLTTTGMQFLEVNRELEGFAGDLSVDAVTGRGAVASAKGEFATLQFFGTDGKQGPYLLSNRSDGINIAIVAGSERVLLDGVLLLRGSEADYVIDYSRGEITFTSRRVITGNAQITVDYQFVTGRYQRRVTFAGARSTSLGPLGALQAGYFVEGDDPDAPVGGALSESERQQLAVLGDSAQVDNGTRFVGDGRRDYQLVVDAESGKEIFVYVEGTGDFDVVFIDVGEGNGEYVPDPFLSATRVAYRFVGEGQGAWTPSRDLPAPVRLEVMDLTWGDQGRRGSWAVEGAISNNDGNVLSGVDDGDNQGSAFKLNGRLNPLPVGGGVTLAPRINARRVAAEFTSPSRFREGFYTRDWNLIGTETVREENLLEGGMDLAWNDRLRWSGEVGRMALADTFQAVRQRQDLHWTDAWVDGSAGWITTQDEVNARSGKLDRKQSALLLRRWSIQPKVRGVYETRRRANGSGERHRGWETGLVFPVEFWPVGVEVGYGRTYDDSLNTVAEESWNLSREANMAFASTEGRWRDLTINLRYEARRVKDNTGGPERRDSGRLDLRHQAVRGAWSALLTSDLGTVGLRRRTKTIVAVPEGEGFFDQFGNYVGPGGGYDVEYGPPSDEVLTGLAVISSRLRWSPPGPEVSIPRWLRSFAWEGYVNINEASRLPLVTPRVFLNPRSYLNPEYTVDGRMNARQILDLFPRAQTLGLRLRQERTQSLTQNPQANSEVSLVEERSTDVYAATLRSVPAPGWDAELEGSVNFREEGVGVGGSAAFTQDTRIQDATLRGGRRIDVLSGRGRASADITYSKETGEAAYATGWIVRPRLQWSLSGRGRVDVRYTRSWLTDSQGFTGIRGPGASTLQDAARLDVLGEVRLHRSIVLTGAVGVIDGQSLDRIIEGRMEVRGSF